MLVFQRRKLPAASTLCNSLIWRNFPSHSSAITRALAIGSRFFTSLRALIPVNIRASDFSPMPGSVRNLPVCAADSSNSMFVMPACFQNIAAFFGPRSCTLSNSISPGGTSFSNFCRKSNLPVVSNSWIFSAIASPTPGMARMSFSDMVASSEVCNRMLSAAWR